MKDFHARFDKAGLIITLLICFFIAFFSWFTFRKFEHGLWCGYDQGTYSQILWNTLHGRFFWCSFTSSNGLCDLGVHMNPTLVFLLPVYMLFPFPATLSIIQVFFLGIAAAPVYLIAKEKINSKVGLFFVVFYLTNTFVVQAVIEGFQARALTVPLFLFAFYYLFKKRYRLFSLFVLLACLSHEISCLLVFMIGLYLIFTQRKILPGAVISALSLSWFVLSIKVFQPYFGIKNPLYGLLFTVNGKVMMDPLEIIRHCLTHPIGALQRIFTYRKLDYIIRLFAPLGFMSIFSLKELLIGLPIFLQNLVLSEHLIKIEVPRYTMPLLPFIFISAIYSTAYFFKKMKPQQHVYIEIFVIVCWAVSAYRFIWDPSYNARFLMVLSPVSHETRIHRRALERIAYLIPRDASVCADMKAFPFLANRFKLYDIPFHMDESEYILIDKKEPLFSPKSAISKEEYPEIMNKVFKSPDYVTVGEEDGVSLLKRKQAIK